MDTKTRVAITGIGMVTPLGNSTEATWNALMDKKSGIGLIQSFDASGFDCQIAGEVKNFDHSMPFVKSELMPYTMPFTRFGLSAAHQALEDAGIRPTEQTASRWGVVSGTAMIKSDHDFWEDFKDDFVRDGKIDLKLLGQKAKTSIDPYNFASTSSNMAVTLIAQNNGIRGYTSSVHTACASGGQALGLGMRAIRHGRADYVLAGGVDSMISPMCVGGFCLLGSLCTDNHSPTTASRPFDLTRKGFVLGEGSTFLVLERYDAAKQRGARIYAELAGAGNSLSGYRITDSSPTGDGAIQAIEGALRDANIGIDGIDYINAHGTSTRMNDISETNAIKHVFKERAKSIPVSSTKSQLGHLISAAGAAESAISALSIYHSRVPMTANYKKPDPECDLDYVIEGPRKKTLRAVMSNSFGFGGSNSCVVIKQAGHEGVQ